MPYKIFICYRRTDKELARAIEGTLTKEFGSNSVFLDVESIYGGQKWKKSISNALSGNPVVITLITTKWNSKRGGQFRLMDTGDHVRYELETALERQLSIVPVIYERAYLPKTEQLPTTLEPLLQFQKITIRNETWNDDLERLINGLKVGLKVKSENDAKALSPPIDQPSIRPFQPINFKRSMFTLTPDQQKKYEENRRREADRLARIRAEALPFYTRISFWICVVLTFALSLGSVFGAERLTKLIAGKINLDLADPSLTAGILLACLWAILWLVIGAIAYSNDRARGAKVFYTRGILGGWVLGYEDWEPIGYWAAFPLATGVLWLLARSIPMLTFYYWNWDYQLIFWVVLCVYTLPVLFWYGMTASEEVL